MRPDGDQRAAHGAEVGRRELRDAQLGRRAAPEEIARRGSDHREIRPEISHASPHLSARQVVELRVDDQGFVPVALEQRLRVAVFERQVRLAAAEIDAALEAPVRIDESVLHDASVPAMVPGRARPRASSSHS